MKRSVGIISTGAAVPEYVLTNDEVASRLNLHRKEGDLLMSDAEIHRRTGIRQRRKIDPHIRVSDLAIKAGEVAMSRAGIVPDEIGLILYATNTPDHIVPASASRIQDALKCTSCGAMDIHAGCASFVCALRLAFAEIVSGGSDYVLVIGADGITRYIDFDDRSTCMIFGDGAGAVLLGQVEDDYGFKGFLSGSDGSGYDYIHIPAGGSERPIEIDDIYGHGLQVSMRGHEVFTFAVSKIKDLFCEIIARNQMTINDVDLFVPHQANERIITTVIKKLGFPREKTFVNIDHYGNTAAASIPLALNEAAETGRIQKGMNTVIAGVGAGLAWGATLVKWAY